MTKCFEKKCVIHSTPQSYLRPDDTTKSEENKQEYLLRNKHQRRNAAKLIKFIVSSLTNVDDDDERGYRQPNEASLSRTTAM